MSFTSFSSLRTSPNFLSCVDLADTVVIALTKDEQQTAKRQRATSFIFSVSAAGNRKSLFKRFTGNANSCVAYLFILILGDTGKPLILSWKAAKTDV